MKNVYTWLLWIFSLTGLGAIVGLLSSTASEKNRVLGSFSGMQILSVLGVFFLMFLFAWAAFRLGKNDLALVRIMNTLESSSLARQVVMLAILVFTGLLFGLDYLLPYRLAGYLLRLAPFLVWLEAIAIASLAFLVFRSLFLRGEGIGRRLLLPALYLLPVLAIPGLVILFTHHGLFPGGSDATTVKLASYQFYLAFLAGFALHVLTAFLRNQKHNRWFESPRVGTIVLFLLIWLCAVIVWNQTPFQGSYNALGPFPPNKGFVPSADSIRFDLPGQTAMVGTGFYGRNYVDNAFYGLFVMFLRLLAGQNYDHVIFVQILFLALTPAVIFLIAVRLGSAAGGVSAALLYIFREANVVRTANDQWMASVKVLLTEPFVTLLLCLVIYFFILWIKRPARLLPLCLAGGLFGLSTMVRANPWFFLVVMGFLLVLVFRQEPLRMVFTGLLLGVFILAGILPWMVRCQKTIGTPFYMVYKYQHSVVEERYLKVSPQEFDQGTPEPRPQDGAPILSTPVDTAPEGDKIVVGKIFDHILFSYLNTFFIFPGFDRLDGENQLVIFPSQLASAWQNTAWQNTAWLNSGLSEKLLYLCGWLSQLFLCAAGLVSAFRKLGLAGFVPAFYAIAYHAGNALALTSGSRYSQPVDWVYFLYFSVGAFSLVSFDLPASDVTPATLYSPKAPFIERCEQWFLLLSWIMFFSLGLMLPLSDIIFPQKYPGAAFATPLLRPLAEEYRDELQDYSQVGYATYAGRLIYPMFYKQGAEKYYGPESIWDQDRMIFRLVGSPDLPWYGQEFFLTLGKKNWPAEFLGGKDVLVAACPGKGNEFVQAAAVFLVMKNRSAILQSNQLCARR